MVCRCFRYTPCSAVIRHPAMFLFDEATSALDSTSERLVQVRCCMSLCTCARSCMLLMSQCWVVHACIVVVAVVSSAPAPPHRCVGRHGSPAVDPARLLHPGLGPGYRTPPVHHPPRGHHRRDAQGMRFPHVQATQGAQRRMLLLVSGFLL
jgi:hypothetical protein